MSDKPPRPSPRVIQTALREMVKGAVEDGAIAALLIYETSGGGIRTMNVPGIDAVRFGLLRMALSIQSGDGE